MLIKITTTYAELYNKITGGNGQESIPFPLADKVWVQTPTGNLTPVLQVIRKPAQSIVRLVAADGRHFECSEEHLFQDDNGLSVRACQAKTIATTTGPIAVTSSAQIAVEPTYDIEIPSPHWYVSPNGFIHHNTFFVLGVVKQWLEDNPDGGVIYFDTESAVTNQMLSERGIDLTRIVKSEPETIEQFRQTALQILDRYDETPQKGRQPMLMVLDSLGNLSSAKEVEDIRAEKDTRDMTKAGLIRGTFRVLRLRLAKLSVPLICTNHVYAVVGCLTGSSSVIMADGTVKNITEIAVGDMVETLDGPHPVTDLYQYEVNDTYDIEFEDGTIVQATPNHKFMTTDGRWVRADELSVTDEIRVGVMDKVPA